MGKLPAIALRGLAALTERSVSQFVGAQDRRFQEVRRLAASTPIKRSPNAISSRSKTRFSRYPNESNERKEMMNILSFSRRGSRLLIGTYLSLAHVFAAAQDYPTRPVRLVVGGGSDVPARVVANYLTNEWKQQINVEPIPSAGGVIAAKTVKEAQADGYTLLNSTGAYLLNQAARNPPPFVMSRDFVPVGLLGTAPQIVVVPVSLPIRNLSELVAYANSKPNSVNCASAGVGGSAHLACEMLRYYGKADVTHIAYKGVGPAMVDVMAGRVQLTYTAVSAVSAIKEGRVRAIAVTGSKRLAALPDVPTVTEQGFPQLTLLTWYGIHAPVGTPAPVLELINREIARAVKDPSVAQSLVGAGLDPETMSVAAFRDFMNAQEASITKLWRDTGAKIE